VSHQYGSEEFFILRRGVLKKAINLNDFGGSQVDGLGSRPTEAVKPAAAVLFLAYLPGKIKEWKGWLTM